MTSFLAEALARHAVEEMKNGAPPSEVLAQAAQALTHLYGGEGSGNWGHAGRPGYVGGSSDEGAGAFASPDEALRAVQGTKITDTTGAPLLMLHGSSTTFNKFDKSRMRLDDLDAPFNGFWFSERENEATPALHNPTLTYEVYLDIKKPATYKEWNIVAKEVEAMSFDDVQAAGARSYGDMVRMRLLEKGYDGAIWNDRPVIDRAEFASKGETTFRDARGARYTLKRDPKYGSIDLYDGSGMHLTGYDSIDEYVEQNGNKVVVAFDPDKIHIVNRRKSRWGSGKYEQHHEQEDPIAIDYAAVVKQLDRMEEIGRVSIARELTKVRDALIRKVKSGFDQELKFLKDFKLTRIRPLRLAVNEHLRYSFQNGRGDIRGEVKSKLPKQYGGKGSGNWNYEEEASEHLYADPLYTPTDALRWLDAKSFYITDLLDQQLTAQAKLLLMNAIRTGEPLAVTAAKLFNMFVPYVGDESVLADMGDRTLTANRLMTIVRTNTTDAYNHGRLIGARDPDLKGFIEGMLYSAVIDSRTTEICRFMDGKIIDMDAPELDGLLPPNHFNCRSLLVSVPVGVPTDRYVRATQEDLDKVMGMIDIGFGGTKEYEQHDYGGEGSGNWGHEGRPGHVGGSASGGELSPSKVIFDNPGGQWLEDQRGRAKESYAVAGRGVIREPFTITAMIGDAALNPNDLLGLPGQLGEENYINQLKVDQLSESIKKEGLRYPPMIVVGYDGRAAIWEGNHRIRAAVQAGLKSIPVEVKYLNGGEDHAKGALSLPELKKRRVIDYTQHDYGGQGSGNWGHKGRPGEVGGSADEGGELKLDKWFDRRSRSWVVQLKDAEGNQVGDAIYVGTKKEAESITKADFGIEEKAAVGDIPEIGRRADAVIEAIEERQEDIDSKASMLENTGRQAPAHLAREHAALEGIKSVVENARRAVKTPSLAENSLFLISGGGAIPAAALHATYEGETMELKWIGSTKKGEGTRLLQKAVSVGMTRGVNKVKGVAKWGSFPYYEKLGAKATGPRDPITDSIPFELDLRISKHSLVATYGGKGSGNWGHKGRPGEVGGSADEGGGTSLTDAEIEHRIHRAKIAEDLINSYDYTEAAVDASKYSPADRIRLMRKEAEGVAAFSREDRYNDRSGAWEAFRKEMKGKDPETIMKEGLERGFYSLTKKEGFTSLAGRYISNESFLRGMSTEQKHEFMDRWVDTFKVPFPHSPQTWPASDLAGAGWTQQDIETFADKLDAVGARDSSGERDVRTIPGVDYQVGRLWAHTKNYEEFRNGFFESWSIASNAPGTYTARAVMAEMYPGAGPFYQPKDDWAATNQVNPGTVYSPERVKAHMAALKLETENFYKKKFKVTDLSTKPLEVYRGIGGYPEAYTPASVESWTRDKPTVKRFGKMMSNRNDEWSGLTTNVTYNDILWSYESAKGQRGWPPDKDLKGKKEYVVIGSRIKQVKVDKDHEWGTGGTT